jgi:hypothetical protein
MVLTKEQQHEYYIKRKNARLLLIENNNKLKNEIGSPEYAANLQYVEIIRLMKLDNLKILNPSISYLGCSAVYFKSYLEKKRIEGIDTEKDIIMYNDNSIIVRIKPITKFNLDNEDEMLNCCHYSNYRIVFLDDVSKTNEWNCEKELFWVENISRKEYFQVYL